jgi:hypothetical protein
MLIDRLFGLLAAVAFAIGLVCQVGWIVDVVEPSLLYELTALFVMFTTPTFVYVLLHAGKRDGFVHTRQGVRDMSALVDVIPPWARTIVYWFGGIGAVLTFASVFAVFWPAAMPIGRCIPGNGPAENCLMAHYIAATMISIFGTLSFMQAVYLMGTSSRK